MFAVLLVFFFAIFFFGFYFIYFCFCYLFLFFCKIKKIAQMGRDITQIIERLPKSTLHATAACPAHKLLTQMRENRHTHTHTSHTPHRSVCCYYIYRVSICIHIPYVYVHLRHDEFSPAACLFIIHKLFVDISMLLFCEFSECQTKNENKKRQRKEKLALWPSCCCYCCCTCNCICICVYLCLSHVAVR